MGPVLKRWQESTIWQELERRGDPAEPVRLLLHDVLPPTEQILQQGGTSAEDFTLHDAQHSFRVAEIMATLAGDLLSKVYAIDLTFLLLSAYGHDIGMTPSGGRVRAIHDLLLTGEPGPLDDDEITDVQRFLDNQGALTIPLSDGTTESERLTLARLMTAHYVRSRHNDWSAEHIAQHWSDSRHAPFDGWVEEIIKICRSHHEGYDELCSGDFDPRLVGADGDVLHRRWCACILRIADVLDFDPERTPDLIFRHRDVSQGSEIFWAKDQAISFKVTPERIVIHASPRTAQLHKAVAETIEWTDREMAMCGRLADRVPFEFAATVGNLPHKWRLESYCHATVAPLDNAYEFIDGAFRPDTQRILDLLGGLALYQSSWAAIRELLQNAFDAVRIEIALRQLEGNLLTEQDREALCTTHRVTLEVVDGGDDGLLLVCTDQGVGMHREALRRRFLIAGTGSSHRERELERRCAAAGIPFERTARFGIGVLSYFLIADRLVVVSRPQAHPGERGEDGWSFAIAGTDDFGELTAAPDAAPGTRVTLRLRPGTGGANAGELAASVAKDLENLLVRLPCSFSLRCGEKTLLDLKPGWGEPNEHIWTSAVDGAFHKYHHMGGRLVTAERERSFRQRQAQREAVRTDLRGALRLAWSDGDLDGLGHYRVAIPYFEMEDGRALAYVHPAVDDHDGDGVILSGEEVHSWRGMAAPDTALGQELLSEKAPRAYWWFDWTSELAGRPMVHRDSIVLADRAHDAVSHAEKAMRSTARSLVANWDSSRYDAINARIAGMPLAPQMRLVFPTTDRETRPLEDIAFPWVERNSRRGADPTMRWRGQLAQCVDRLHLRGIADTELRLSGSGLRPTHLAFIRVEKAAVETAILVYAADTRGTTRPPGPLEVEFPPDWADVVACRVSPSDLDPIDVFNPGHPLVTLLRTVTKEDLGAISTPREIDSDKAIERAASGPASAAAWLARICLQGSLELWAAVHQHEPQIVRSVVGALSGGPDLFPLHFVQSYGAYMIDITANADGTGSTTSRSVSSDASFLLEPDANR